MHHEFYFLAKKIVENKAENKLALATIVHVQGSAYRREGTRMIIDTSGKWFGNISGGCLEGDIRQKAKSVIESGIGILVTYDTRESENKEIRVALGCNGIINILIEPVTKELQKISKKILAIFDSEEMAFVQTLIQLNNNKLQITRKLHYNLMQSNEDENYCEIQKDENSYKIEENIGLQRKLIIWGSGPDTKPLADFSKNLGWRTIVASDRISKQIKESVSEVELIETTPEKLLEVVNFHHNTALVLVSHNYFSDLDVLMQVVKKEVKYIGLMGPKRRGKKMVEEVKNSHIDLNSNNIFYPVGLDIGSDNPVEIALSIVAEIQSVFAGKKANSLKNKTSRIHDYVAENDIQEFNPSENVCSINQFQ